MKKYRIAKSNVTGMYRIEERVFFLFWKDHGYPSTKIYDESKCMLEIIEKLEKERSAKWIEVKDESDKAR